MIMIFHREGLVEEAKEAFKQAEVLIERDVVRTRCTFSDSTVKVQQNTDLLRFPHVTYIHIMYIIAMGCRSVLLAYALYDPMVSYTQGMTDLLAPLLVGLEDEAMSFWCFTKLVERSVFFKRSSVSLSMEDQLVSMCTHCVSVHSKSFGVKQLCTVVKKFCC